MPPVPGSLVWSLPRGGLCRISVFFVEMDVEIRGFLRAPCIWPSCSVSWCRQNCRNWHSLGDDFWRKFPYSWLGNGYLFMCQKQGAFVWMSHIFYVKVDLGYCSSCSHLEIGHVSTCLVFGSLHVVLTSPEEHMSLDFSGDDIWKMFHIPRFAGYDSGYVHLPLYGGFLKRWNFSVPVDLGS